MGYEYKRICVNSYLISNRENNLETIPFFWIKFFQNASFVNTIHPITCLQVAWSNVTSQRRFPVTRSLAECLIISCVSPGAFCTPIAHSIITFAQPSTAWCLAPFAEPLLRRCRRYNAIEGTFLDCMSSARFLSTCQGWGEKVPNSAAPRSVPARSRCDLRHLHSSATLLEVCALSFSYYFLTCAI